MECLDLRRVYNYSMTPHRHLQPSVKRGYVLQTLLDLGDCDARTALRGMRVKSLVGLLAAFASIRPRSEQRLRESRRRDSMLSMMFKLA